MPESETKTEWKPTYPVEVEYLDGTKETIDFPRMSSEVFFEGFSHVQMVTGVFEVDLARQIVRAMVPGLLDKMKVKSGISLVLMVLRKEKDNFELGELMEPVPAKTDGTSESQDDSPASSSTT